MRLKVVAPIFSSVFMAELGDKTQVATVLFVAGGTATALEVFLASSAALVLSTFLAVLCGAALGRMIPPRTLKTLAGTIFIAMGGYFIYSALPLV
ncbi:MAG: TMEM165/GDT1 family protein [Candidatus Adiutrix sp.]